MRTNAIRSALLLAAGSALFFAASTPALAATASATVSATVLGPAGDDTASGAVSLSRIGITTAPIELGKSARSQSSTVAQFRVGGGLNASFAVSLPQSVVVRGNGGEIAVSGFRAAGAGRLGSDGTSTIAVGADVRVPAGQLSGLYTGSFPVTIAYN